MKPLAKIMILLVLSSDLKAGKMKHELKIIMTFHTEDIDHDQAVPLYNYNTVVSIDDQPIGCIQKLNLSVDCKKQNPEIEFVFPDLVNLDYDMEAYNRNIPMNRPKYTFLPFAKEIGWHIDKLKLASNIKTKIEGIDDGMSEELMLDEIGTDGHIDYIPIKRRHSI